MPGNTSGLVWGEVGQLKFVAIILMYLRHESKTLCTIERLRRVLFPFAVNISQTNARREGEYYLRNSIGQQAVLPFVAFDFHLSKTVFFSQLLIMDIGARQENIPSLHPLHKASPTSTYHVPNQWMIFPLVSRKGTILHKKPR